MKAQSGVMLTTWVKSLLPFLVGYVYSLKV